jgi:hypothetical protein
MMTSVFRFLLSRCGFAATSPTAGGYDGERHMTDSRPAAAAIAVALAACCAPGLGDLARASTPNHSIATSVESARRETSNTAHATNAGADAHYFFIETFVTARQAPRNDLQTIPHSIDAFVPLRVSGAAPTRARKTIASIGSAKTAVAAKETSVIENQSSEEF